VPRVNICHKSKNKYFSAFFDVLINLKKIAPLLWKSWDFGFYFKTLAILDNKAPGLNEQYHNKKIFCNNYIIVQKLFS